MESRHSVADGEGVTGQRLDPGNPVAGVPGQVFVHSSQLCQIGESDQGHFVTTFWDFDWLPVKCSAAYPGHNVGSLLQNLIFSTRYDAQILHGCCSPNEFQK
jgi:hypothetical protein